jgi:hypothetical protein
VPAVGAEDGLPHLVVLRPGLAVQDQQLLTRALRPIPRCWLLGLKTGPPASSYSRPGCPSTTTSALPWRIPSYATWRASRRTSSFRPRIASYATCRLLGLKTVSPTSSYSGPGSPCSTSTYPAPRLAEYARWRPSGLKTGGPASA